MKLHLTCTGRLLACVLALLPTSVLAATLYSNDFDGNFVLDTGVDLNAATNGALETAAPGFGGWSGNYFVNRRAGNPADPTVLSFSNLGTHSNVSISFLLGFLEGWKSRDAGPGIGPDNLDIIIDGVQIARLTANNSAGTINDFAGGTLLFDHAQINNNMRFADTLVDMSTSRALTFAHSASTLEVTIRASGAGWTGGANEGWGVDAVNIAYDRMTPTSVPEPAGLLLTALALTAIAALRRVA